MEKQGAKTKTQLKDRAYQYSIKIIRLIDALPKDNSTQIISRQLLRSATSIGANITEAQAASSRKDFANFFSYSLKSANESVYWLSLLKDAKKFESSDLVDLLNETKELANILGASLLTLRNKSRR